MIVLALSAVLWVGMVLMLPLLAIQKRVWLMLALFVVVLVGTVANFRTKRRSFAATLDSATIEKMKSQSLAQSATRTGRIGVALLSLPRFNIAHLLVFTFVCAVDVWAVLWDPYIGCCVAFVTQVLYWTLLRVRAVLHMENQSQSNKRRQWFWGVVINSVVASIGAVVAFLVVLMVQVPMVVFFTQNLSDAAVAAILLGFCVPIGSIAAAVCLCFTWPKVMPNSTHKECSVPKASSAAPPPTHA